MVFDIYTSNCTGQEINCYYPQKIEVVDVESLKQAVRYDHTCSHFRKDYRSKDNFLSSNVIPMDCDNDDGSMGIEAFKEKFKDVDYALVPSRNNMKPKGDKPAVERYHVFFPIKEISDVTEYEMAKKSVQAAFPFFDPNALGAARFLYGSTPDNIIWHEGGQDILTFIGDMNFEAYDEGSEEIKQGSRNATMSHIAGKLIVRYGNTDEAYHKFLEKAEKCSPPLSDDELKTIWNSATKFGKKVAEDSSYIPPECYNLSYKPDDYTDVGQAVVLSKYFSSRIRYSTSTDYICYNGSYWEESKPKAQDVVHELTDRQLEEANMVMKQAMESMGVDNLSVMKSIKAKDLDSENRKVFDRFQAGLAYEKFTLKMRGSWNVSATLTEARPMVEIDYRNLDANEFLINTPGYTFDLRKGLDGRQEHSFADFITKQTSVDPSDEGAELWNDALDTFFCGDKELEEYVQLILGLAAIGKVYIEALIIAYGGGKNGKSTFFNVCSRVLGSYSGSISADVLTAGNNRNVKPELAEARGKRLLIAAELEEGMRLNTSTVKQLCSTDEVFAERKYKDPFSYVPTHSLVLYTNHLPKVGAIDNGTWRRIIIIPFEATIDGNSDIKNYADYLFTHAGGAILSWIIKGAQKVIEKDYKLEVPEKVEKAVSSYRENNDWMGHFLDECCVLGKDLTEKSGELYRKYREFCMSTNEHVRSTTEFYAALTTNGFSKYKTQKGSFIKGLNIKSDFLE